MPDGDLPAFAVSIYALSGAPITLAGNKPRKTAAQASFPSAIIIGCHFGLDQNSQEPCLSLFSLEAHKQVANPHRGTFMPRIRVESVLQYVLNGTLDNLNNTFYDDAFISLDIRIGQFGDIDRALILNDFLPGGESAVVRRKVLRLAKNVRERAINEHIPIAAEAVYKEEVLDFLTKLKFEEVFLPNVAGRSFVFRDHLAGIAQPVNANNPLFSQVPDVQLELRDHKKNQSNIRERIGRLLAFLKSTFSKFLNIRKVT